MNATNELLASLTETENGKGEARERTVLRAFAWARVSTETQDERGESIEEQLRQIRDHAKRQGIEIVGEHSETASAFRREEKRVDFHRMLEEAKRREDVNAILVHDFSRFSRDSHRARALVHELREAGIEVLSVTDPVADPETAAGVWVEGVTFLKNEAYSREVSFHTIKGCKANVKARDPDGKWCYKNGGQPLWGYRAKQIKLGDDKRGRPILKTIWELDDTEVAGRPIHEWVHHCLVELAGEGASLHQLRDFCEKKGLPARRKSHWGISTWNALLQPQVLMKYCGVEVWNVHGKRGRIRPTDEWVIVESAHPAILTPEEAKRIVEVRRKRSHLGPPVIPGRSRTSPYLLSGGLFKCARCGANMVGQKGSGGVYYICGSAYYRRGKGCGKGVYVPVDLIEAEAIRGVGELLANCSDRKGFAKQVNDELRKLWEEQHGPDLEAQRRLLAIEKKITNVRQAIEDGIQDTKWANARLEELSGEQESLQVQIQNGESHLPVQIPNSLPPRISVEQAMRCRKDAQKLFAVDGATEEKKKLLRIFMQEIKLAPERLEIELTYRIPEHFMVDMVAGAGFEPATFGL